jgi:flagellar hook assembly protein FlgD
MSTSALNAASGSSTLSTATDSTKSFRNADFLKIMLAEVTNQSPFDPQETSKLVENMQKLQELANSTYDKYRADLKWAQDLMGKTVNVQQQALDATQAQALSNKGLKPDVGYGNKNGTVTSFRVVDETVYVTVNDKDYPVDNVKQVVPENDGADALAAAANQLLGRKIGWFSDQGQQKAGIVTEVLRGADGALRARVGSDLVVYDRITSIGTAS